MKTINIHVADNVKQLIQIYKDNDINVSIIELLEGMELWKYSFSYKDIFVTFSFVDLFGEKVLAYVPGSEEAETKFLSTMEHIEYDFSNLRTIELREMIENNFFNTQESYFIIDSKYWIMK